MYEADREYDLNGSLGARELADVFVSAGFAEEVEAGAVPPTQAALTVDEASAPAAALPGAPAQAKPGRKPKA